MKNVVAIVGRPNVGKSSLFNKLVGHRKAIVHDQPGVTRDRLYETAQWTKHEFKIIDTGGIAMGDQPFQTQIKLQAEIAIEEARVILFVVDGINGLTKEDEFIAQILRKSNKKILVLANKLEGNKIFDSTIWTLGFKNIFAVSALHGEGLGDVLDEVMKHLDLQTLPVSENLKLAIIGRPNAGKSSLLNALVNQERAIVSEIAGTTRDTIDAEIHIDSKLFTIVDTAGINRKSKLLASVDHYALARARQAIVQADIVLLMIDYARELAHFDAVVGGYAFEEKKPLIIIVNKWDLVAKSTDTMQKKQAEIRQKFKYLAWAPIIFISAKTGGRIEKLKTQITKVAQNKSTLIKTHLLNEIITDIQLAQPAQSVNGGRLNIKFAKMVAAKIPTFIFWVNKRKYLHFSYARFLENKLREYFDFTGTPLNLIFRETKGKDYEKKF